MSAFSTAEPSKQFQRRRQEQARLSEDLPNWRAIGEGRWRWRGEAFCELAIQQQMVLQDEESFNAGETPDAERYKLRAYTRKKTTDQWVDIGTDVTARDACEQIRERAETWMANVSTDVIGDLRETANRASHERCHCGAIVAKTNRHNHLPKCPLNTDGVHK